MITAKDHQTGLTITRPDPLAVFKYDFDFRKRARARWIYLSSSDRLSDFGQLKLTTLNHNGQYRIIENKTGKIVEQNTNPIHAPKP